jgi:hypothetical protein
MASSFIQDITINVSTAVVTLTGETFIPLILGGGAGDIAVETVTATSEMADLGYLTTDDEYLMLSAMLAQDVSPSTVKVARCTPATSTGYVAALDSLEELGEAFYSVCIDEYQDATIQAAVATWCAANDKLFIALNDDVTCADVTTIGSQDRTAVIVHDSITGRPDAAIVGLCMPVTPWATNWHWKELNGVTANAYNRTQLGVIRTAKGIGLQGNNGSGIYTNYGRTTSGKSIMLQIGQDWITDQLNIEIYSLLLRNKNVPIDDTGIAQVESVVRSVLKRAGDQGIIGKAVTQNDRDIYSDDKVYLYKVTVPLRADLSTNDRSTGNLSGVKFIAYSAGSIDSVVITGTITI